MSATTKQAAFRDEVGARLRSAAKAGHDIVKAYDKHETICYWELCDKGFGMDEDATDRFIKAQAKEVSK